MFLDGKHWTYIREKTTTGLKQSWTWITQIWRIMELEYQLLLPVVHHGLYMTRWISRAIHCVCFQMITKNVIQDSIPKDCKIYPERLIVPVKDATKTKELNWSISSCWVWSAREGLQIPLDPIHFMQKFIELLWTQLHY